MFNETIPDEREVLAVCLDRPYLGTGQVVRSLTRSGVHGPTEARTIFYVRGNLEGPNEETLADFLAKNREQHPIEPNFNPGGTLGLRGRQRVRVHLQGRGGMNAFSPEVLRVGWDAAVFAGRARPRRDASDALCRVAVRLECRVWRLLAVLQDRRSVGGSWQLGTWIS